VSVGEADYTKTVLNELGKIDFWKLAIKPGKPFAFGHLPNSYFIGLPGNPVSALVTLHQLAIPMLRKLSGEQVRRPLRLPATVTSAIRKSPGRTDFQRGVYSMSEDGRLMVENTGAQGSGILTSMSRANCYIILEQMRGAVEKGETVLIEPFDSLMS
jgi:molybdopterin molybdotransferase